MVAQLLWYIKLHATYDLRACLHPCTPTALINPTWLIWAPSNSGPELSPYIYNINILYIYTCRNNYIFFICIHIHISCSFLFHIYISCSRRSSMAPPLVPPGNQGFGQGVRVMRDALLARLDGCHMDSQGKQLSCDQESTIKAISSGKLT